MVRLQRRSEKILLRNGANEVVYPEKQLAKWTAIRYGGPRLSLLNWMKNHAMFEIPVPKKIGRIIRLESWIFVKNSILTLWESRKAASWSYLFLQTQC